MKEHTPPPGGHAQGRRLTIALLLTLAYAAVELLAGLRTGSLALLADASHMLTDSASLAISAFAAWLAARPASPRHTYGYGKAGLLAALLNGVIMLAVVAGIATEAWQRLRTPVPVDGGAVGFVALLGLMLNLGVAWVLSRGNPDLNVRAALLHVIGDALGSLAAIVAGTVIWLTGWTPIDPILSILMGGLILASTARLMLEALRDALDAVPAGIELPELGTNLAAVPGVREVHDLHVWSISPGRPALSAHVRVTDLQSWPQTLAALEAVASRHGIAHFAFQPAPAETRPQPVRFHPPHARRSLP